ncbi:FKBP-type peptidyl-prolyl cis-trans isomerase [Desulfovermiculus halophilus]|jgi:peptidylprolyl isomerase|uniref:FKBP-type peptidyl-prolyl cis-trans isomerase n=1 Tax=Desulfovermiculus halophilus TaxID=339722 RepID=UPI000482A1AA|nr:peptidylprolyl isomerase [Desulfovermiculus halophilus]
MSAAKSGDLVKVHYRGTLQDGTVFDSSYEGEPLEFTLGQGQIIPGFEEAVEGMAPGENKTVQVEKAQGYGDYDESKLINVERSNLPDNINPEEGMVLQVNSQDNDVFYVTVNEVKDEEVVLDGNHPLAGKDLTFEIELVDVQAA